MRGSGTGSQREAESARGKAGRGGKGNSKGEGCQKRGNGTRRDRASMVHLITSQIVLAMATVMDLELE